MNNRSVKSCRVRQCYKNNSKGKYVKTLTVLLSSTPRCPFMVLPISLILYRGVKRSGATKYVRIIELVCKN